MRLKSVVIFNRRVAVTATFVMLLAFGVRAQDYPVKMFCGGVKAGVSVGDYRLTAPHYNVYKHHMTVNAVGGAWLQLRTKVGFSIRPEVAYAGKGANLEWEDVHYRLRANCIDMRLGLLYNFTIKKTLLSPYIVVAPLWDIVMDGGVEYTDYYTGDVSMQLSTSSMKMHDFGLFCGVGLEYPIYGFGWSIVLSGEVGYGWGLSSNFSNREQTWDVTVVNPSLDQRPAMGYRLSRGIEATLRVGVPFGKVVDHRAQTVTNDWLFDENEELEDEDGFADDDEIEEVDDEFENENDNQNENQNQNQNSGEGVWEANTDLEVEPAGEEPTEATPAEQPQPTDEAEPQQQPQQEVK